MLFYSSSSSFYYCYPFFFKIGIIIIRFTELMKFPFFFLHYVFIVIVIIINMDLMCKNDYMCAMLVIKP